jgi:hypothetical protein
MLEISGGDQSLRLLESRGLQRCGDRSRAEEQIAFRRPAECTTKNMRAENFDWPRSPVETFGSLGRRSTWAESAHGCTVLIARRGLLSSTAPWRLLLSLVHRKSTLCDSKPRRPSQSALQGAQAGAPSRGRRASDGSVPAALHTEAIAPGRPCRSSPCCGLSRIGCSRILRRRSCLADRWRTGTRPSREPQAAAATARGSGR